MCACVGGGEENVWSLPTMFHEQLECKPFANYMRNSHDLSRAHCTTSAVRIQMLYSKSCKQRISCKSVCCKLQIILLQTSHWHQEFYQVLVAFHQLQTMSCWLCRVTLSRACDRRRVYSSSTSHVVPILEDFLSSFQSTSHRDILERSAVLCRQCKRSIEKLITLKEEVKKKEQEIGEKVKRVCEAHGVHVLLVSDETRMCTPTKRSASEAGLQESTPSRRKRTRYDTPTRRRLAELVQTSTSPAVEVS